MGHETQIDFTGKVALVTGAGYGMGRASARRFARAGAQVVVADFDDDHGHETVEMITSSGGAATFVHADVRDEDQVAKMVEQTVGIYGGLDFAHNNAGILAPVTDVHDYPRADWDDVLATNLTGVYLCMKYEIPRMLERGNAAIVNVASEARFKADIADPAYTASKHGVVALTGVAALQYIKRGIRVNAIAPGNVETGIVERGRQFADEALIRWIEEVQPIGRISQPEEIAEIVLWLCSNSSGLINGATIVADTGWHLT